ncbi:MAG: TraB/GumN family protein [Candidatus Nanohaloarchaea archaeon]
MIFVYGTSHVSEESLELIEKEIDDKDPDIVALELDINRLHAMLNDNRQSQGPVFIRGMKFFQDMIGKKTGVMPGDEMTYAYNKAVNEGRDIALIDQDIRITVQKLQDVSLREKVKAGASLLLGMVSTKGFDMKSIPHEDFLDQILGEMKFKFPQLYEALVADRNHYMKASLEHLQDENPDEDIIAFVGAAHKKEIERMLAEDSYEIGSEDSVERQ